MGPPYWCHLYHIVMKIEPQWNISAVCQQLFRVFFNTIFSHFYTSQYTQQLNESFFCSLRCTKSQFTISDKWQLQFSTLHSIWHSGLQPIGGADFHQWEGGGLNESEQIVGVMLRSQMMSRWSESLQVKSSKPHYSFHSGPLGQISFTTQVCACVCVSHSNLCQCPV